MKEVLAVLAGQPNCGKSTLFNMLTGARQYVANYPGVTVEKKSGVFNEADAKIELVDLPGSYSLSSYSPEEIVTREFIIESNPDVLISVLDASTLEKSLYLSLQLMEIGRPTLVAMNMLDVAKKRHVKVDASALEQALGVPVIPVQASANKGRAELRTAVATCKGIIPHENIVNYGMLEEHIENLVKTIEKNNTTLSFPARWLAIKLLEGDGFAVSFSEKLQDSEKILQCAVEERQKALSKTDDELPRVIAVARYKKARSIAEMCSQREEFIHSTTEKIDDILCHRFWGPLCLMAILYVFYEASVTFGNYVAAEVWPVWGTLEMWVAAILPAEGFLYDPIITAMGTWVVKSLTAVLNYLPIFAIMFALVAILEDSGYMARIAFILDKLLHRFGLHGQSTLPLVLGGVYVGGCAIPGIIATKAIPNEKARLATILIVPMMNCLAKVPLYLLLISAFFAANAGGAMFFMATITLLMGLIVSKIFSLTVLRGKPSAPFIIELPIYHRPSVSGVLRQTFDRIVMFLYRIGSVVLAVSVIVFVLISFPSLSSDRESFYTKEAENIVAKFLASVEKSSFAGKIEEKDIMPLIAFQADLRDAKRGVTQEKANKINAVALEKHPVYAAIVLRKGADGKALASALRRLESERKTVRRHMKQEIFESSFLGRAGKALEGVTSGAGFSWRINVALLSALAAKENSAATLGAIYGLEGQSVGEGMSDISGFTPLHALALMLFMSLYPPCLPAAIMVKVQAGNVKWMIFSILFQITIGLSVATFVFSVGSFLELTGWQAMWSFYALCVGIFLLLSLIPMRDDYKGVQMSQLPQKLFKGAK